MRKQRSKKRARRKATKKKAAARKAATPEVLPPADSVAGRVRARYEQVALATGDEPLLVPIPGEDPGAALMRIVGNAVASAQPIEVIERLLVVHERYEAGVARKAYAAAMASLRGELPRVFKTDVVDYKAKGGRVFYMHENLAAMVEDLSPVMARHGLAFRWDLETTIPESIHVTCIITHAAGHQEETTLSGPPDTSGSKNAIQAIASTVSYLQRYTLKAAVGIAAGKDDDGAGGAPATRPPTQDQPPIEQPRAQGQAKGEAANGPGDIMEFVELWECRTMFPSDRTKTITTNQIGRLRNLAGKAGWTVEAVDDEIARVLSMKASEIPSIGDGYEAIVSWFQNNPPGGAS